MKLSNVTKQTIDILSEQYSPAECNKWLLFAHNKLPF